MREVEEFVAKRPRARGNEELVRTQHVFSVQRVIADYDDMMIEMIEIDDTHTG